MCIKFYENIFAFSHNLAIIKIVIAAKYYCLLYIHFFMVVD